MKGNRISLALVGPTVAAALLLLPVNASALPVGWTCTGSCGTLGADGVVTTSPEGGTYEYITTTGAPTQSGLGLGDETNGTVLTSADFTANGADVLSFYFNYVTSDGAEYTEYAWVQLMNAADNTQAALLFTARTNPTPGADTVPGFGMPTPTVGVTLVPPTTPIIPNLTTWSPLGLDSGDCYDVGCGYTDWIQMSYTPAAGTYYLLFGVVNWLDEQFDTGLAIDGALIGDTPIGGEIPEPGTLILLGSGLLVAARKYRAGKRSA